MDEKFSQFLEKKALWQAKGWGKCVSHRKTSLNVISTKLKGASNGHLYKPGVRWKNVLENNGVSEALNIIRFVLFQPKMSHGS